MEEQKEEKIVVEYFYTFDEFKTIQRRTSLIIVLFCLVPTIFLSAIFILELFFGNQKINFFSLTIITLLVVFLLVFIAFHFTNPDTQWKLLREVPKNRKITIENEGMLLETNYSYLKCSWTWVRAVLELKKMYIINNVLQQSILIPKEALNNDQEKLLRSIFERNVPPKNIRFKKRKDNINSSYNSVK